MRKTLRQVNKLKNKGSLSLRSGVKPIVEIHKWGKNARVIVQNEDGTTGEVVLDWSHLVETDKRSQA